MGQDAQGHDAFDKEYARGSQASQFHSLLQESEGPKLNEDSAKMQTPIPTEATALNRWDKAMKSFIENTPSTLIVLMSIPDTYA